MRRIRVSNYIPTAVLLATLSVPAVVVAQGPEDLVHELFGHDDYVISSGDPDYHDNRQGLSQVTLSGMLGAAGEPEQIPGRWLTDGQTTILVSLTAKTPEPYRYWNLITIVDKITRKRLTPVYCYFRVSEATRIIKSTDGRDVIVYIGHASGQNMWFLDQSKIVKFDRGIVTTYPILKKRDPEEYQIQLIDGHVYIAHADQYLREDPRAPPHRIVWSRELLVWNKSDGAYALGN